MLSRRSYPSCPMEKADARTIVGTSYTNLIATRSAYHVQAALITPHQRRMRHHANHRALPRLGHRATRRESADHFGYNKRQRRSGAAAAFFVVDSTNRVGASSHNSHKKMTQTKASHTPSCNLPEPRD
jgi:hypothetical protein